MMILMENELNEFGIANPQGVCMHFIRIDDEDGTPRLRVMTTPESTPHEAFERELAAARGFRKTIEQMRPKDVYTIRARVVHDAPFKCVATPPFPEAADPATFAWLIKASLPYAQYLAEHAARIVGSLPDENAVRKKIERALRISCARLVETGAYHPQHLVIHFDMISPPVNANTLPPSAVLVNYYLPPQITDSPFAPTLRAIIERATMNVWPRVVAEYAEHHAQRTAAEAAFYAAMATHHNR